MSIFRSAVGTFLRWFCGVFAVICALTFASFLYSLIAPSPLLRENTTLEMVPNAEGERQLAGFDAPVILQIPITGVIGDPKNVNTTNVENVLIDSRMGLLAHDRVKGILLVFNTPGGTVVDSDNIYRMLREYKEKYRIPVYAYIDGFCASGGIYIASAADQSFASPSSVIGSVGVVFGPFFNIHDTLDAIGIKAQTITEGLDKDMMNPTRPWKPNEDASFKAITSFFYKRFVDIVTAARPRLDKTKLINEYGAKVFDAETAQKLGYIDHALVSRNDALTALLTAAHIDPSQPYQVVQLLPKQDWLSELVQGKSPLLTGTLEHTFDLTLPPRQLSYLYAPTTEY